MSQDIYWNNLQRGIDRQLDWISGYGIDAQIWLMEKAIARCQQKLEQLRSGELQKQARHKTRHGAGKDG